MRGAQTALAIFRFGTAKSARLLRRVTSRVGPLRNERRCLSFGQKPFFNYTGIMFAQLSARLAAKPTGINAVRVWSWGGLGARLVPWAVPLAGIAGWMVYPALTLEFKQTLGLPWVPAAPEEEE